MPVAEPVKDEEDTTWSSLFDAHCHPTDTMGSIKDIPTMNVNALTIMATRAQDQELVANVAEEHAIKSVDDVLGSKQSTDNWRQVVPSFGWHPWFSYQLYDDTSRMGTGPLSDEEKQAHYCAVLTPTHDDDEFVRQLPAPRLFTSFIDETRQRLKRYPLALIGEVGLDRAFRLPRAWLPGQIDERDPTLTPGGREGRRLSPYRVQQHHQIAVLLAQLSLAGEAQRPVSVHGVQAHGVLYETLRRTWRGHEREVISKTEKKRRKSVSNAHDAEAQDEPATRTASQGGTPYPPRVCLHSFSGPVELIRQYLHEAVPVDFFFSFSVVINFSTGPAARRTEEVVKELPADRVLVESDMHIAGERMEQNLKDIASRVCELKGWSREEGESILAANWKRFIFGDDAR